MSVEKTTFVIIGGGIAGVSCAEALAFLAPEEPAILITQSPFVKSAVNLNYITKTLTAFQIEEKNPNYLNEIHPAITVIHDQVKHLDSTNHIIITNTNKSIEYKKLCICTGGEPKLIDTNNPNVFGIRDTHSVQDFQTRAASAKRIVIVGNGGIATEIVHKLENIELIWAVKDQHISAAFIDPGAAEFFQDQALKKKDKIEQSVLKRVKYTVNDEGESTCDDSMGAALGPDWYRNIKLPGNRTQNSQVTIEYGTEVVKIRSPLSDETQSWPVYVELSNGKIYGCDLVVSATGVSPNSRIFLDGNQDLIISEDGGFQVDWKMETSVPDVFAAGDVCTANWPRAPHWFQMKLWTQARQMGLYAAKSMQASLTQEEILQDFCFELFSHVTQFFGYKVILLGLFNGQTLDGNYEILMRVTKGEEYIKLVLKEGRMQGAILIGETDLEEMCENLILNQLDLTPFGDDLLNPNIDIDDYFD